MDRSTSLPAPAGSLWHLPTAAILAALLLGGCQNAPTSPALDPEKDAEAFPPLAAALEARSSGLVRTSFPEEDPGPPFYSRVSPYPELLNQVFTDGRTVAIPVYRDPACIPADFNHFLGFDPPSPAGPGAFACPLLISGTFLIEAGASPGSFPIQANATGPAQFWFVDHDEFLALTADGTLPHARLAGAFTSLRIGTADHFQEILRPRTEPRHQVLITAQGRLTDGGRFGLSVNHMGNELRAISIRLD